MAIDHATAFWIQAPGRGALLREPLAAPAPDELMVRALHGAVSRGTELLVYRGLVPSSEFGRMRAPFQKGELPGPVKYGYVNVGRVIEGPADLLGRDVFCLHPHQDHYVVPVSAVHLLPAQVPAARAVLAANMETALNGVWDAGVLPGDRVVVVGAGVVGLLAAWLADGVRGCTVEVVEPLAERRAIGTALGLRCIAPGVAEPNADVVIHASGCAQGLRDALTLAGFEAHVIELSWFGTHEVSLPLGQAFHAKRLQLISSQVGTVATRQRARWSHARRMALALSLLADPRLDALITGQCRFEALPALMQSLDQGSRSGLCDRIDYVHNDGEPHR